MDIIKEVLQLFMRHKRKKRFLSYSQPDQKQFATGNKLVEQSDTSVGLTQRRTLEPAETNFRLTNMLAFIWTHISS